MRANLNWLADPTVFRVNRLDAHSDHVAFASAQEAAAGESSLRQCLDGQWAFCWSKCPADRPADFWQPGYDLGEFGTIRVPGHMETQGFGQIQYINKLYAWDAHAAIRPPQVDMEYNPVGSYVREVDLEAGLRDKGVLGHSLLCKQSPHRLESRGLVATWLQPGVFNLTIFQKNPPVAVWEGVLLAGSR